ncbi:hypothetical protein [Pseudoxanthomonas kaohsiungensis]|uniref:Uncharacterized protein n=1 Tax=Pseudoxanthomonas kaohsiungensis TaxID=283923 RepID=A0ABW3LXX8_9GAMM|nr:hypothetical protein [Pseudoxanthomonas kaohsiungensis]KAF1702849.1 hypothetical protein CSC66_08740 [Pseudoxanthomonas kaohsiungensis]
MLHLSQVFAFRPLDRLQVASKAVLREACVGASRLMPPPFWFFQYVRSDGLLALRGPGGYEAFVDPLDVCDVRAGQPVAVRAMDRSAFCTWTKVRSGNPSARPPSELYSQGQVMFARKDRWGRAEAVVRFDNQALNDGERWKTWVAPLHADDQARLQKQARRSVMPVMASTSANWSADAGIAVELNRVAQQARSFIRGALAQAA